MDLTVVAEIVVSSDPDEKRVKVEKVFCTKRNPKIRTKTATVTEIMIVFVLYFSDLSLKWLRSFIVYFSNAKTCRQLDRLLKYE